MKLVLISRGFVYRESDRLSPSSPDNTESPPPNIQQLQPTEHRGEGQNTERNGEDRDWMKDRWGEKEGGRERAEKWQGEAERGRGEPTERWMQRGRRGEEMV